MNKKVYKNEKGQTLLFVVVAMTIALAIGINASVRTVTSLSRTARTDTSSRALSAAEGGIERFLSLSTQELESAIGGTCAAGAYDNSTGACKIEFDDVLDVLVSQAFVTVERYAPLSYPFTLESGQVKEVNLYDFTNPGNFYTSNLIKICWTSRPQSDIMYLSYNSAGVQARGGITGDDFPGGIGYVAQGFDPAGPGQHGYKNCEVVDIGVSIYGLRIRSVGGTSDVAIYGEGATLPLQGYVITSVGTIEQDQSVTASRTIRVIRTLPYLPVSFDYALFSQGGISK
ncbi:hypothetical protein ACFLZK_02050 [Patescibacteria group bacterium]